MDVVYIYWEGSFVRKLDLNAMCCVLEDMLGVREGDIEKRLIKLILG